ncbi:hypothetical protein THMIRHAM_12520 [Thiomicrorhabdus immobilis]|uniref:Uncharacterized protein n=2 Tax=Thiomicrorhabdus immobilis TaxID=2791037 RepID=A0ABN6CZY2_9GAMM|nr:hypothetical protein THMIRHAM_12520 [Thiomicrorhabdus immobilis]
MVSTTVYAKETTTVSIGQLSPQETLWIGNRIFQNECASKPEYLTYWGNGEDFPSFGIGHFIWYPTGVAQTFDETFPEMVNYVNHYQKAPFFLQQLEPFNAPWQSKKQFDQAWSSMELKALRDWLLDTQAYQAEFIVQRFQKRFAKALLQPYRVNKQEYYTKLVGRLAETKQGRFALIDYVNFKGFGSQQENYQGQGWGLFSVLDAMQIKDEQFDSISTDTLLSEFVLSAKSRLALRARLAPPERDETRWLAGWFKRLEGYLEN